MASLENRTGYWSIAFRFGGKKYNRSLATRDRRAAEQLKKTVENTIWRVEQGVLELPENADVISFFLSGGRNHLAAKAPETVSLGGLVEQYKESVAANLERTTLYTLGVHTRHLLRILGGRLDARTLALGNLDSYVQARRKQKTNKGTPVSPNTIRKEVATLRAIWSWAAERHRVAPFPDTKKLNYGKVAEKPPFQTWEEIERQVARGGLTKQQEAELWDCLFLSLPQVSELLDYVKDAATQPFVYPMVVMAAHTGARRSELIRSKVNDFLEDGVILHERKRSKGKYTTRRVPLSTRLRRAIAEWLKVHPGGQHTFCQYEVVRSKKDRAEPEPLTGHEAHDHLKRTLNGSKWAKLRGWHVLRHSFISNCALKGIDQRIIDSFVGHTTEEMRRRYTHLFPSAKRDAIRSVFG
jgi:integrase